MEVVPLDKEIAIRIENLTYTYPDGTNALKGINLIVRKGESVALMGPNGAGKSTLILHLNGILKGNGKVEIHGLEVNKKNIRKIRSMVGLVFQDPDDQLFSSTVREDVAFGPLNMGIPPDLLEFSVRRALEWVGMSGSENRSPHHLSIGEKKRVSIATVLAMEPEILALDEPGANLDPRGRREISELIKNLKVTRIVVTHDLNMAAEICSRAVVLSSGRIVADGPIADILSDEKLLLNTGLL